MIRAFSFAMQHCKRDVMLLICGAGSMQPQIEALVRKLGLEENVRFLGVRRDIPDVMNAADAFVLSSDTEGLPMVLLQASASALPILATAVGGNAEVVQHNRTGFLVNRGDVMALADAMERIHLSGQQPRPRSSGRRGTAVYSTTISVSRTRRRPREKLYQQLRKGKQQLNERHGTS